MVEGQDEGMKTRGGGNDDTDEAHFAASAFVPQR